MIPAHIDVTIAPTGTRLDCHVCGMHYVDRLGVDPRKLIDVFAALHSHDLARNAPVPATRQGPQRRPGLDRHPKGTPATREARKLADSDTTTATARQDPSYVPWLRLIVGFRAQWKLRSGALWPVPELPADIPDCGA